jgi:hypothetical protein
VANRHEPPRTAVRRSLFQVTNGRNSKINLIHHN